MKSILIIDRTGHINFISTILIIYGNTSPKVTNFGYQIWFSTSLLRGVVVLWTPCSQCSSHIIMTFSGVIQLWEMIWLSMQNGKVRGQRASSHRTKNSQFWSELWVSRLNSRMASKWCTKFEVALNLKRCPFVFRGHPSNFRISWSEKLMTLTQDVRFPTVTPICIDAWLRNDTNKF